MVFNRYLYNCINFIVFASALISFNAFSATLYKYQWAPANTALYATPELACQNMINDGYVSSSQTILGYNNPWCETNGSQGFAQHRIVSTIGSCPEGYVDNGSGQCEEDNQCPVGQVDIGNGCEDICPVGSTSQRLFKMGETPQKWVATDGCTEQYQSITENCKTDVNDDLYCYVIFSTTGDYTDPSTFDYSSQLNDTDEVGKSDIEEPQTTESFEITEPVTEAITDGTATTTVETTTTTNDSGSTIEAVGDSIIKKDSTGNIIEVIEQTTFNQYNDGSANETITKTTNATSSTITETTYDIVNNTSTTNIYNSGSSGTVVETTTTDYNNLGQVTSSDTTKTGSIQSGTSNIDVDGDGSDDLPAFCDYAEGVCEFMEWVKGDDFTPPEHEELPTEEINVTDYQSDWTSGLGSGSCPADIVTAAPDGNGTVTISFSQFCWTAENVIYWILIFITTIGAGYIIAGLKESD